MELRGDEALAVFDSARQALRAASDLQERFVQETVADPSLPLAVGIGLDAGEAVPVDGGYRGGALNLAARLCSLAGPGEVLVSPGVAHRGGSGGFVKLWDAKTLAQIGSAFPGSPGRWANAQFTPDGSHLVTIYDDGCGAVWPVTPTAWAAKACAVAHRNFTLSEWQRFVGGRSYSRVCPKYAVPAG